jgi:hypothetical protein
MCYVKSISHMSNLHAQSDWQPCVTKKISRPGFEDRAAISSRSLRLLHLRYLPPRRRSWLTRGRAGRVVGRREAREGQVGRREGQVGRREGQVGRQEGRVDRREGRVVA